MRKSDIVILGLLCLLLSGCRLKRPENVLAPKRMEQFLYDYHLCFDQVVLSFVQKLLYQFYIFYKL